MFTTEEIKDAIANPKLVIKKKIFLNTPSWESFIGHLNYEFYNDIYPPGDEDEPYNPDDTVINGVNIREHFYLMNTAADNPKFFPQFFDIQDELNKVMETEYFGSFTLINFVGGERPINVHCDPRHSFYWQTHGTSIWQVFSEKDLENPLKEYEIGQGDMIFVPHGIYHSVVAPEPRTAISFMYSL
jgi:hypothetical protein